MSKRVALMTWHHVRNYGTALQAYALKIAIERNGFTVDLIDYRREYNKALKYRSIGDLIRGKLTSGKNNKGVRVDVDNALFEQFFSEKFSYTQPCRYEQDLIELNEQYDVFVCGSDQIWGPEWFNPIYFLKFVDDPNHMVAYAPSIGVNKIKDGAVFSDMKSLICRFPSVSVREEPGCEIVRSMGVKDVFNALDPVLLLEKEDWIDLSEPLDNLPGKYALVFFLKNNKENLGRIIEHLRNKGIAPIVFHSTQSEDNSYANYDGCKVEELLYLIEHAESVYTDSFHVTVLSIIYNKQFTLFFKNHIGEKNSKNSRLVDLLGKLELLNNIFDTSRSIDFEIDYPAVNAKLKSLRRQSLDYLYAQLKRALSIGNKVNSNTVYCPHEGSACEGKCTDCYRYIENNKTGLTNRMNLWNFALEDKCYTCKWLEGSSHSLNTYRPLFYSKLQEDLKRKKHPMSIYMKYYSSYDLPMRRKKKN